MKGKIKPVLGCAVSAVAISMISSMAVMAASGSEIENTKWTYKAVANVNTQVNIRANASTDSAIVGYLPKAGSADVIEKGEEWSHIISGGVEGYIKNEFLAYGEEAKNLASVYGTPGVEISWDDVNLFSNPDDCSKILNKAKGGSEYTLLNQEGAWYSVQMDDVTVAYVPTEDVQKTIILERAIPVETSAGQSDGSYTADTWQPEYAGDGAGTGQDTGAANSAGSQDTSSADSTGSQDTGSYNSTGSQDTGSADNSGTQDSSYNNTTDQGAGTTDSTYTDNTSNDYTDTSSSETGAAGSTDTSGTENSGNQGTDVTTPSEETVTNASTDDVSLLAALIYCEAGNQSREGKVAVGAVVMNRIASGSYPGTISDVIYQSGQFAPAITGWLGQVLASGAPSDCYEAAQAALNGENPVPGALYFNTSAGKGTKIGDHWFY